MPHLSEKSTYSPCGRLEVTWIKSGLSLLSFPLHFSLPQGKKSQEEKHGSGCHRWNVLYFPPFSFFAFPPSLVKWRSELMCPHHWGGRDYGSHALLLSVVPTHAHFLCRSDLLPSVCSRWTGQLSGQDSPSSLNLALPARCHAEHLGAKKNDAQEDASDSSLKKLFEGKIIMTTRSREEKEILIKLMGFFFFSRECHTDAITTLKLLCSMVKYRQVDHKV